MGRPTKYQPDYAERGRYLAETFGATDEQLAKALGVSAATLYNWKREHAEFLEALAAGKAAYDTRNVETSILRCAQGYWYQEEHYDVEHDQIVVLWKVRHPEIKAQALWMINRQQWRLPAGERDPAGPPGVRPATLGRELPPAVEELPEGMREAARAFLEGRYRTRLRVPCREVAPPAEPATPPAEPRTGTDEKGQTDGTA